MFTQRRAAADESAGAGEGFAAGVRHGDDFGGESGCSGNAATIWTVDADGVGFVED